MKIKSIRFVYEVRTFFGNRKQVDDETDYVTEEQLKKALRELKKNWQTTALWVHTEGIDGEVSLGFLYDNAEDAENNIMKAISVSNNGHCRDETKLHAKEVKKLLFARL